MLPWVITTLRLVLAAMLLILAVISTLKGSVVMYKETKKWQPNHYMQLFVKDGILYFVVYVSLSPFFEFHSLSPHYPTLLLHTKKLITVDL